MQAFPLFLCLKNRQALVVGGANPAARKIELLLSSGAKVSVVARTVAGDVAQLIAEHRVRWAGPDFSDGQLAGMSLVVVATDDAALQDSVSRAAQARCLPVNVVDRPTLSSFLMPAIVDRDPVTIAISTGGAAPALARKVRAEIERLVPAALGRVASFADLFRDQVRRSLREPQMRRRFWDRVFEGPVAALALAGDEIGARRELIRLLDGTRNEAAAVGKVHLVDAGAGDPDLLTLKVHRLLQQADVIAYDEGVSARILAAARRDAERLFIVQRLGIPRLAEAEIDRRLAGLARSGKTVVCLKGGGSPVGTILSKDT
ncbi:MAG: hypothetical protein JSR91_13145 [Proteobacteria bacterium]|nr:hypothetical protein [Pseudomonadota bacterium]